MPSNALFKLPVVLTVCSVNRQSKLVEPRCSVPLTALRTNLVVHDLEETAPAQCETAAGRGVAGELANHFCFAYFEAWRQVTAPTPVIVNPSRHCGPLTQRFSPLHPHSHSAGEAILAEPSCEPGRPLGVLANSLAITSPLRNGSEKPPPRL